MNVTTDLCWDDTPPTVCTQHLRFAPCRTASNDCNLRTDDEAIELVRWYQQAPETEGPA